MPPKGTESAPASPSIGLFRQPSFPQQNIVIANQSHHELLTKILGRKESLLANDMASQEKEIADTLSSSRILVIGAAGSIGSAFVKVLSRFRLRCLHLVDLSENCLVEVVRDLRSSGIALPDNFQTFAIDFSQTEFKAMLRQEQSYDFVLNFSALKHVRSERDPFTLMRLLQINVLANDALANHLCGSGTRTVFSVSSDKSVRPGNLMGASKALMERVFLSYADQLPFTSARFANVAFSAGSLLASFERRLAKFQPLSAPTDVRRYFISHQEAGELCFLGCFLGSNREIFYPQFEPANDMLSFAEIAHMMLESKGLKPRACSCEAEALTLARSLDSNSKVWPCFFSSSDTSGEKPYEEFVDPGEETDESRFEKVGVVTKPLYHGDQSVADSLTAIRAAYDKGVWSKTELANAIRIAVPELDHVESDKNLDQKM